VSRCHCGQEIPEERIEMGFNTCIAHASASKKVGYMVYGHKTAGEVVILDGQNKEHVRQAERAYRRDR
jgi:hypothetical protein